MQAMNYTLKYKGWFGLCPVYTSDVEAEEGPLILERHPFLLPLMMLSEFLFSLMPAPNGLPIKITGALPAGWTFDGKINRPRPA